MAGQRGSIPFQNRGLRGFHCFPGVQPTRLLSTDAITPHGCFLPNKKSIFHILANPVALQPTWQRKHMLAPAAVAPQMQRNVREEHLPVYVTRRWQLTASFEAHSRTWNTHVALPGHTDVKVPKSFGTKRALMALGGSHQARSHHTGLESSSGAPENNERLTRSFAFCRHRRRCPQTSRWANSTHLGALWLAKSQLVPPQLLVWKLQAQLMQGAAPALRRENQTPSHPICYQLQKSLI